MRLKNQHCQRIAHYFRTHRLVRIICLQAAVMSAIAVALVGIISGNMQSHAQTVCAAGDTPYDVVAGDSLSMIAPRYQTTWQELAQHNSLANPDVIFAGQRICIPGKSNAAPSTSTSQPEQAFSSVQPQYNMSAAVGKFNSYPYGQCTWWADERYHQLHGVYVPWLYNSDAGQWAARARQYGWQVSSTPIKGSIIVLAPWTQGAYQVGHVAIVENILPNGHVLTSNMNWGGHGTQVVNVEFQPGAGVSFVTR